MVNETIITQGSNFIIQAFHHSRFVHIPWVYQLLVIPITLAIITKDLNKWKVLALPVSAMWLAIGFTFSPIWWVFATIMFGLEIYSLDVIGNILDVAKGQKRTTEAIQDINRRIKSRELKFTSLTNQKGNKQTKNLKPGTGVWKDILNRK